MKIERLSDQEVSVFLNEARALRNAYLAALLREGAMRLRAGLQNLWHAAHGVRSAAALKPIPHRRVVDIDQFVVR